jgi:hypothetical protein
MSIEGRIAIDVNFADSSDTTGVQSLKKVSLVDTTSYSSGKVAIITGTCGTAAVTIAVGPTTYRDAAGDLVSFTDVSRIAFAANPASYCNADGEDQQLLSNGGRASVSDVSTPTSISVARIGTAGTASYTLVLYGT